MGKRTFPLALSAMLFALCSSAEAQQPARVPRIGYLSARGTVSAPRSYSEGFRQGLRELGYIEGKNILIEFRYAEGKLERFPSLVAELVQLKVDLLVSTETAAIRAAKEGTKTIPIVFVTAQDPVAAGYVDSLARPGGNMTGLTRLTRELSGKRLELLKEVVPGMSRVGLLGELNTAGFKDYETAARALKIQLQSLEVRGPNPDFEGAFQTAAKVRVGGLITIHNFLIGRYRKRIADLAMNNRLPSMYEDNRYVEEGGLVSYSANELEVSRRAAVYVDKILKGRKPAELPVEQPTKFDLVINLKTAKQIGVTIPQTVLFRADKVIR